MATQMKLVEIGFGAASLSTSGSGSESSKSNRLRNGSPQGEASPVKAEGGQHYAAT